MIARTDVHRMGALTDKQNAALDADAKAARPVHRVPAERIRAAYERTRAEHFERTSSVTFTLGPDVPTHTPPASPYFVAAVVFVMMLAAFLTTLGILELAAMIGGAR